MEVLLSLGIAIGPPAVDDQGQLLEPHTHVPPQLLPW